MIPDTLFIIMNLLMDANIDSLYNFIVNAKVDTLTEFYPGILYRLKKYEELTELKKAPSLLKGLAFAHLGLHDSALYYLSRREYKKEGIKSLVQCLYSKEMFNELLDTVKFYSFSEDYIKRAIENFNVDNIPPDRVPERFKYIYEFRKGNIDKDIILDIIKGDVKDSLKLAALELFTPLTREDSLLYFKTMFLYDTSYYEYLKPYMDNKDVRGLIFNHFLKNKEFAKIDTLLSIYPEDDYLYKYGRKLLRYDFDKAREILLKIDTLSPLYQEVMYLLGFYQERRGELDSAYMYYKKVNKGRRKSYAEWRLKVLSYIKGKEVSLDTLEFINMNKIKDRVENVEYVETEDIKKFRDLLKMGIRKRPVFDTRNELYTAMVIADSFGFPDISIYYAIRLKRIDGISRELLSYLYPVKFSTILPPSPFYLSLMRQESWFRRDAVSPAGAMGVMQLLFSTARGLYKGELQKDSLFSPRINIELGIKYINKMLKKYNNDTLLALAAYNAGPGNVNRWKNIYPYPHKYFYEFIPYRETSLYVKRILRGMEIYRFLLKRGVDILREGDTIK